MRSAPQTHGLPLGLAIYTGLVGLAFTLNFPGRLTPDSVDALTQAAHPEILNDWHEPTTLVFWLLFAPVLGQPASALLSQALLVFIYPAILIERAITNRLVTVPIFLGFMLFIGALIAVTGIITKDIVLVGLILSLLAAIDIHPTNGWRLVKPILFAVLVISITLIRPTNSLYFAFLAICWIAIRRIKVRIAIPSLILVFIATAASPWTTKVIDRNLFGAADAGAADFLFIFDVAGISTAIHKDLFAELPGWLNHRATDDPNSQSSARGCKSCPSDTTCQESSASCRTTENDDTSKPELPLPWDCYTPIDGDPFASGKCNMYFALVRSSGIKPARWWLSSIAHHPIGYVIHRSKYAFHLVRSMRAISISYATNAALSADQLFGPFTSGIDMRGGFQLWEPRLALVPFEWISAFVFSRPILVITIFVCLFVLVNDWKENISRRGVDAVEITAAAIGLGNVLMLIAFGVGAWGRYLLPTFVCGLVIMFRRLARSPGFTRKL